jgi:hypothetical protein
LNDGSIDACSTKYNYLGSSGYAGCSAGYGSG